MTIDEDQVRERLAVIVADVRYEPDSQAIRVRGQRVRRRRRVAAAVSTLIVIALGVALPVVLLGGGSPSKLRVINGSGNIAPLADVKATPAGWSPIGYRDAQISVPAAWLIENPGTVCGEHDPGRVFIAESATLPLGDGCGLASNVVVMRSAAAIPLPHRHAETVNGVHVETGWTRQHGGTTYLERGLGLDISATGPLGPAVLRTLTHSPLSVLLHSTKVAAPTAWRRVHFGGLQFAVPPAWQTQRESGWGGCPENLQPAVLVVNTARTTSDPGCGGAPQSTAGTVAGVAGMVVGAGPGVTDQHLRGEHCVAQNALRICIYPPPLYGGYPQGRGLEFLTALVYLPGHNRPDQVEIGLNGSGLVPTQIFNSLTSAD